MSVKPIPEGLATASPDDEVLKLGELLVDRTKPTCHFLPQAVELLVDGVELLVNRVETRSRFGLESGEFLTEGVDSLAIGVGLDLDALHAPGEAVDTLSEAIDAAAKGADSSQHRAIVGAVGFQRSYPGFEVGQ